MLNVQEQQQWLLWILLNVMRMFCLAFSSILTIMLCSPPYHIIMQKDENVTHIHIPAAFISYEDGEMLLLKIQQAAPWMPVLVSLNRRGECTLLYSRHSVSFAVI